MKKPSRERMVNEIGFLKDHIAYLKIEMDYHWGDPGAVKYLEDVREDIKEFEARLSKLLEAQK